MEQDVIEVDVKGAGPFDEWTDADGANAILGKLINKDRRPLSDRARQRLSEEPDGLPYSMARGKRLYHIPTIREWLLSRLKHPNPTPGARRARRAGG